MPILYLYGFCSQWCHRLIDSFKYEIIKPCARLTFIKFTMEHKGVPKYKTHKQKRVLSGQVVRGWNNQESFHKRGDLEGYTMQGSGSNLAIVGIRLCFSDNVVSLSPKPQWLTLKTLIFLVHRSTGLLTASCSWLDSAEHGSKLEVHFGPASYISFWDRNYLGHVCLWWW